MWFARDIVWGILIAITALILKSTWRVYNIGVDSVV